LRFVSRQPFSWVTFRGGLAAKKYPEQILLDTVFCLEKSAEDVLSKISGEPRRTRTCNPLIKSQLLYH
jgi:hypothetical protein